MQARDLSAPFLACNVPVDERGDALECALRDRVDAGRNAWPTLGMEDATFVRHLATHVHEGQLPPLTHAPDLWLTCACASGVPGAVDELNRAYRVVIVRAAGRVGSGAEDVAQQVLTSLLMPEGDSPPRIASYGGRSSLRLWLRTVAARAAFRRRSGDDEPHDSVSALAGAVANDDPELRLAKMQYAPEVEEALRVALGELDARQRVLLRLHHVDGWSIDRLGALYKVGRSTAARWVSGARAALLMATKAGVVERLGLTVTEVDSLLGALQSALFEVSLVRLLEQDERA